MRLLRAELGKLRRPLTWGVAGAAALFCAGLIAVCWAALAAAGPVLVQLDHLPGPHESLARAAGLAGSQAARALLVLAAFAAIGLLAAVLARGAIGAMALSAGAVITMLVV